MVGRGGVNLQPMPLYFLFPLVNPPPTPLPFSFLNTHCTIFHPRVVKDAWKQKRKKKEREGFNKWKEFPGRR